MSIPSSPSRDSMSNFIAPSIRRSVHRSVGLSIALYVRPSVDRSNFSIPNPRDWGVSSRVNDLFPPREFYLPAAMALYLSSHGAFFPLFIGLVWQRDYFYVLDHFAKSLGIRCRWANDRSIPVSFLLFFPSFFSTFFASGYCESFYEFHDQLEP